MIFRSDNYSQVFNTWSACPFFWPDFDQILGQIFDQGFWPGFWRQKIEFYSTTVAQQYSFTVLLGPIKPVENNMIKNSILLDIPYIGNLAVYDRVAYNQFPGFRRKLHGVCLEVFGIFFG